MDKREILGYIVGETTPTEFLFVVDEKKCPQRWDYVVVNSREFLNGEEREVEVLSQIETIFSRSMTLNPPELMSIEAVERIIAQNLAEPKVIAKARVIGFIYNGNVLQPRRAIFPGNPVYRASKKLLKDFYSYPEHEGIFIGYLISREDVEVYLSVRGFRRHLAILAQTGAGKSYTAGVLIEELLEKGATVVVIDPHGDYVFLSESSSGGIYSDRITVFRTAEGRGRHNLPRKPEIYEVRFSDLSLEEIAFICGIEERYTNIRRSLRDVLKELGGRNYTPSDLIGELEKRDDEGSFRAINYISRLLKMKVFGDATTDILKVLRPKHVSVMDLSGLEDAVADYVTFRLISEIYRVREEKSFEFPVFIIIEEAHRFVPNRENTLSKEIIKRIAAEGRKFGVFLTLITQRPNKIDPDVLSQCNSQIIMRITNPEDQKAVRSSSERMSENLLRDLPGLNVGEAVIVGEITRAPVMVRIRRRKTREGGADIDVVAELQKAIKRVEEEKDKIETLEEIRRSAKDLVEGY
ncbi:MAG: ATP-binding protein [Archaeoglobaceae archaeon]